MSASPPQVNVLGGKLLAALEQFRSFLGLGHNAFARRLGISHSYWHQIRTRKRPISRQFVQRVMVERPDLCHAYAEDLRALAKAQNPAPLPRRRRKPLSHRAA